MRHSILRAGIVASLVAIAATAEAAPPMGAIVRESEFARAAASTELVAACAPSWMTEALTGALRLPDRPMPGATRRGLDAQAPAAERAPAAKPHQNPAFPAAFVFQSNSAMFLAVAPDTHERRSTPAGG